MTDIEGCGPTCWFLCACVSGERKKNEREVTRSSSHAQSASPHDCRTPMQQCPWRASPLNMLARSSLVRHETSGASSVALPVWPASLIASTNACNPSSFSWLLASADYTALEADIGSWMFGANPPGSGVQEKRKSSQLCATR